MREELWKPVIIDGEETEYLVSNFGRVYSKRRRIFRKTVHCRFGYVQIALFHHSKRYTYLLHRLVWETFKGPIPEGYEINHLDEDKDNCSLDNLSLATHQENVMYGTGPERRMATRNKNKSYGAQRPIVGRPEFSSKMYFFNGLREAERELGISHVSIHRCARGQRKYANGWVFCYADQVQLEPKVEAVEPDQEQQEILDYLFS